MTPLDLTAAPPRSPHERLGTVVMLARTIDKLRATLPGGNIGAYAIQGFSSQLLESLGIAESELRAVVASAANDAEIAAWVRERTTGDARANAERRFLNERIVQRLDRPAFFERYPQARDMAPSTPLFDLLDDDDARSFPQRRP